MQNYRIEFKKGQGTYSQVFMATSKLDGQRYALKIMKHKYTDLSRIKKDKQIKALRMFNHSNIIKLIDVLYNGQEEKMALVLELMDCNLYQYYKSRKGGLSIEKIRSLIHGILQGLNCMHKRGIFHRDIKPENILIIHDSTVKIGDLGSCKNLNSNLPFTEYISTRWYRAPECLLTDGYYSHEMDVWSVGCILFELYSQYPLFPGKNQLDQLYTIFTILGTPHPKLLQQYQRIGIASLLPSIPLQLLDLLNKMLQLDPKNRITLSQALNHKFFYSLTELKKYQKALIHKISSFKDKDIISLPIIKSKRKI